MNNSFGRVTKKVQGREEDPLDERGGDTLIEPIAPKAISLRDMVMSFLQGDSLKDGFWVEDDIELKEDNVRKEIIDSVPSIDFFDRVFSLIEKIMVKTLVVKFLRRKIGYNALWNKVCSISN
ncbi:hypothetical protein J1N35_014906 [Gossypium stocksii]|uniref:Uncharacterized protein n=1 Tax=Gossypium stocksii TaxID=47602 RepID=A0A9D4A9D3_9ROSI|nr:hypothetical protein J1N35_014906 [Gossypium stocksii]